MAASRLPDHLMDGEQQPFSIRVPAGLTTKMGGWTAARVRGKSRWIFHRWRIEKSHKEIERAKGKWIRVSRLGAS